METLYNAEFEYQPHPFPRGRNVTRCHLEIIRNGDNALVIATELASNPGKSITNSSEQLATVVVKQFKLDPSKTTFIEHYGDEISYGSPKRDPDHYSTVEYTWEGQEAKRPRWTSITHAEFETMHEKLEWGNL